MTARLLTQRPVERDEERVLLLLPVGRDAELAQAELAKDDIGSRPCANLGELIACLAEGAGAALIAEEALGRRTSELFALFDADPEWSMMPVIVLLRRDGPLARSLRALRSLERHPKIKAAFLHRPVSALTLVSVVRAGLRSRLQQYEMRNLLERLKQDVKRRDEFLAMLGHELRNPVSSIAYVTELMSGGSQIKADTADWASDLLARQVRHLSRLLDELLDVARIQSGKIRFQTEPLDLRVIVEHGAETFRQAMSRRRFRLELPDEPVVVEADAMRLTQVVNNLIENAIKYTEDGGAIAVELGRQGSSAVTRVLDDGRGITAEAQAHIFEPFYQVGAAAAHGLGLGLAMVDNIVRLHGGSVTVSSAGPGQGAVFEVRLPLAARTLVAAAPPIVRIHGPQRLLVVEDNVEVADLFTLLLKSLGHEAHVAYEGTTGVELARSLQPDMVFIDIGLPDISGQEVARRIHATLAERTPPLVALTGYPPRGDDPDAALFRDYLLKPVGRERIETLFQDLFAA